MDALTRLLYFLSYYEQDRTNYRTLTRILENLRRIPELTIQEVADLCFVSTATISRLVQDMDFSNYASFKEGISEVLALQDSLRFVAQQPRVPDASELSAQGRRLLAEAAGQMDAQLSPASCETLILLARAFKRADSICFLINSTQFFVPIQRMLALDGKLVTVHKRLEDSLPYLDALNPGDVLLLSVNDTSELEFKVPLIRQMCGRGVTVAVLSELSVIRDQDLPILRLPPIHFLSDATLFLYSVYSDLLLSVYRSLSASAPE